jgi:hypothetical protein
VAESLFKLTVNSGMEEHYSDTEHISNTYITHLNHPLIVHSKKDRKFSKNINVLRTLILILLAFGSGLGIRYILIINIPDVNIILFI